MIGASLTAAKFIVVVVLADKLRSETVVVKVRLE